MTGTIVKVCTPVSSDVYDVVIGGGALDNAGSLIAGLPGNGVRRAAVVSNKTVFSFYGDRLVASLRAAGIEAVVHLIGDGERFKNFRTLEKTLEHFSRSGITRTDAVAALGGGVVGDLAGLAASLHLRGIPFINIPTTLLAMLDASVGGKTGVNSKYGKNLIGTIRQPAAVLVDVSALATLPQRHIRSGLYEAVKHGALSGKKLLGRNSRLIELLSKRHHGLLSLDDPSEISDLISENIAFKASIVMGDPNEAITKAGPRSRKTLNFGHTLAHAIEKATDYRGILHGEAVGYGILFAAELSKKLANCAKEDVELLNDVVHRVGPLPSLAGVEFENVIRAFGLDKKNIGGYLQMVLLRGIGKPIVVQIGRTERRVVENTLKHFFRKQL
ncbi:MAG: 3-dehydroquinate synthase [Acidobacteriota bacterium]|nr:MAG: 3-dehydroquinate synthase [Acidobacteriota bacterium]